MKKLYSVIALAIAALTSHAVAVDQATFNWWNSGSNDVTISQTWPSMSYTINTDNTGLVVSYEGTFWGSYSGDYALGYNVNGGDITYLTSTFGTGDVVDLGTFNTGDVVSLYLQGASYSTNDSIDPNNPHYYEVIQFHKDNSWGIKATVSGYKAPQGQPLPGVLATMFAFGALFPVLRKKFGK